MKPSRFRFRAWDKTQNKWINDAINYGYKEEGVRAKDGPFYVFLEQDWLPIPNDEIILMQSTGLCDKNGKEIYEGDIVVTKDIKQVVKWSDAGYDPFQCDAYGGPFYINGECEVIGNVYENPDLMKGV